MPLKIGGVDPRTLPAEETLVLPRGDQFIVFKAAGLPNMDAFNKMCPEPQPPGAMTKDGWVPNPGDKGYLSILANYHKQRLAYMIVFSLSPSQIEWETVDAENPATWANWEADLKNAGLSQVECNRVIGLVLEANCLDDNKLKQAREAFLKGPPMLVPSTSSSQTPEAASSQPGEPATV
jgi:hypothetical protein